ncbi:MAG: pseudouridine synthase, partial [Holosporales bacterium]|nr:pseudouridine synthase [Holosporales bacterium]
MHKIRLNKALTLLGVCSRRAADKLIDTGKILINSNQIATQGMLISETDIISVLGKNYTLRTNSITKRIWIYYKPKGLVTTHKDEKNRTTVFDDLKKKIPERVISVGRLDLNSEGLLLITTDNDFAKYAQSPDNGWERKYKVRLFGIPNEK